MSGSIFRQRFYQLVAQVTSPTVVRRKSAGVGFIHNHQLRTGADKLVAATAGFDIFRGDNDIGMQVKQRLTDSSVSFQASNSTGENQFSLNVELLRQLRLPLLGQVRWTQDRQSPHFTPI